MQLDPNDYINLKIVSTATVASAVVDSDSPLPRSELDSHANMTVLGKHCFVFDNIHGQTCEVQPFDPSLGTVKEVPIVDAAVAYDCPYTHKTYILMFRNALHVPSMENNLIPPFIMREAGLLVNDVPKIHADDPEIKDHSIAFPDTDLRIPLQLWGIFSFFHSRIPTSEEIRHCDKLFMTPDSTSWDPYADHFASNEESMLDWEGNMLDRRYQTKHILDMPSISVATADYQAQVDSAIASSFSALKIDDDVDELASMAQRDVHTFASKLSEKVEESKFSMSIGSVSVDKVSCDLFEIEEPMFMEFDDFVNDYLPHVSAAHASKPKTVSSDFLSKIWNISEDMASKVLNQTTQLNRQGADNDLSRHFSTNDRMLRYRRIDSQFFTDTFFVTARGKSSRGHTCMQIYVSDRGYVALYPMTSKGEFIDTLRMFCKEIGVPFGLVVDPSGEQTSREVKKFCHQVGTSLRILEESTQWANRAELYIGLLKESIRKDIRQTNCPMRFWDYCAERRARIHNVTPRDLFQLSGNTPTTATFGHQGDISNICQFGWYDWCYFREEGKVQFPFQKEQLGRVLGPLKNEGNEMSQAILKYNGRVVPRRTLRRLTVAELNSESELKKRTAFDEAIIKIHGDSMSLPEHPAIPDDDDSDELLDEEGEPIIIPEEDPVDATGKAVYEKPFTDMLIHAEVLLPQGENLQSAKVQGRSKDLDGNAIGSFDDNPLLNSIIYDVEFPDGAVKQYAANTIAENMYSQLDSDGYSQTILDGIIDYSKDGQAVTMEDKYVTTRTGTRRLRETTIGWKLLVKWKDGSEQWIALKLLKESNPLEVAEFAKAREIDNEPAFCWWVPYTLRKRDRIISSVNSRVRKTSHKYGIEVPTSLDHAKKIDESNGNRLWQDAIEKEMKNVAVAFEILELGSPIPIGWTRSSGHLVFDVKMDFTRKARWVKDGHRTAEPEISTFAGVVSRESVRIALTYAALNGIDVMAADIKNAYLQAPSSEKHYVICGCEFGLEHVGKVALIRRALYGGKSSGADFWKHLRSCMTHLGFHSCKADPDIWMRAAQKDDGSTYWEYVLLYVDDALCISMNAENILRKEIGKYFYVKEGSVGPPSIYLGNKVSKVTLDNGQEAWSFSSSQYVQAAVSNVEEYLKKRGQSLPAKAPAPFATGYRPEIDVTDELNMTDAAYYQSLIGILRWIVELGRADITVEASMMASCMAMPRRGHLEQLYHMFAFLRKKHNSEMVFDPTEPEIDEASFEQQDWKDTVYGECKEELPTNAPEPRGFGFKMRAFVDSDHAGDSVTRRSRTGFIIFLNNAPIYWTSKKQTSIETSTFGAEFIAMKVCCEYIRGLRYKLRMMGIPCDFPAYVYGDNQSVLANSTRPFSVLKKKSSSIAYHFVREGVARDEWRTTYINTHDNLADLFTKPLGGGEKRTKFTGMILHHVT